MHRLILTAAGLLVLATSVPAAAGGLAETGELEAARANARAGGPVSERDAELLERWGRLSGTRNPFCERTAASTTIGRIGACTGTGTDRRLGIHAGVPMSWWWAV
jgi:hypothetical protein